MKTKSKPFPVNTANYARVSDAFCCSTMKVTRWVDGALIPAYCPVCKK